MSFDMSDDSGIQFLTARSRKRSHREMAEFHYRNQSSWAQQSEASHSASAAHILHLPPLPQNRFPGDGFDYRRPIMSTSDVIDLTNEPDSPTRHRRPAYRPSNPSRPPRFGRNIMADVVDLEQPPDVLSDENPPSSPEVQFIGATIRPPVSQFSGSRRSVQGSNLLDMLRIRRQRRSSTGTLSGEEAFRQEVALRAGTSSRTQPSGAETSWIGGRPSEGIDLTSDLDVDMSSGRDYRVEELNPLRSGPSYQPPSPAPEGFTRTAPEGEVVVCPNCDHELGTGSDLKQQIWVARSCGHVYCGECAKNRSLSKGKKTIPPLQRTTKPFAKCLIPDCAKPVSAPRAMFQIYL